MVEIIERKQRLSLTVSPEETSTNQLIYISCCFKLKPNTYLPFENKLDAQIKRVTFKIKPY